MLRKYNRTTAMYAIVVIVIVGILFLINIVVGSTNTKLTNELKADIAQKEAEISDINEEIEYYEYLNSKDRDSLIEAKAREKGYIYPGEEKYINDIPGA